MYLTIGDKLFEAASRASDPRQWQREPVGVKQLSRTPETPNVESPTLRAPSSRMLRHDALVAVVERPHDLRDRRRGELVRARA